MESARLKQLFTFLEKSPKEPFILFAIAKEYEKADASEQALEYYQKIELGTPEYVGTYYHLGKLQEKMGKDAVAFTTYKKGMAIAKQAGDNHSFSELAGAKMELGDDDDFE
jgi:tetratricopeptide (TPR) repeat protein